MAMSWTSCGPRRPQDKQELEDQSLMNKLATPQVAFGAAVVAGRLKRS